MQLMQGINMFNYLPTHSLKKNRVSVTPGTNNIARPAIFPVKPGRVGVVGGSLAQTGRCFCGSKDSLWLQGCI